MLKDVYKRILSGIVSIVLFYIVYTTADIITYSDKDEKCTADVIIVLGAGATDRGVSPVFAERINHAVNLYNEGYAEYIIMTGGYGAGNVNSDAQIAKLYAVECGVPGYRILLEDKSKITQENIENSKIIMEEKGFSSAIIVSDPLHMKRSMLMAADCGIEAYSSPTPSTRYRTYKTIIPFLFREEFFYVGYRFYRIIF